MATSYLDRPALQFRLPELKIVDLVRNDNDYQFEFTDGPNVSLGRRPGRAREPEEDSQFMERKREMSRSSGVVLSGYIFLLISFFSLSPDESCAQEVVGEREAKTLVQLRQLEEKFEHLADSKIRNRMFAIYILSGYAASNTLGWWFDLGGGGPWFALSIMGVAAGTFSYLIPNEASRSFFWKVSALRKLRKILNSEIGSGHSEFVRESLERIFYTIYESLYKTGRLATSFERWRFLNVAESFLKFHQRELRLGRPNHLQSLSTVYEMISEIEKHAILQKDLPIILRSSRLRSRYLGVIGGLLKDIHWNEWKEWVEAHGLSLEYARELIHQEGKREWKEALQLDDLKFKQAADRPNASYRVRLQVNDHQGLSVTVSSRFPLDSTIESLGKLKSALGSGVWVRFTGLQQQAWDFYKDADALPFSDLHDFGDVEISLDPFKVDQPVLVTQIERKLTGADLRRRVPSSTWIQNLFSKMSAHMPWPCSLIFKRVAE